MDERLEQLGAEVARIQDENLPDERRRAAIRRKLLETPRPAKPRTRRLWRPAMGLALTSVALVALFMFRTSESGLVEYRVGDAPPSNRIDEWIAAPDTQMLPITFTDGASVGLSPGSRARVRKLSELGAALELEHGEATVHVVHRDETRWTVEAGPFLVNVIGTRFRVQWEPRDEAFGLDVLEGTVRLNAPSGARTVTRSDGAVRVSLRPPPSAPTAPALAEPVEKQREVQHRPARTIETPEIRTAAPASRSPVRAEARVATPDTPSYRPPSGSLELKLPPKNPDVASEPQPAAEPESAPREEPASPPEPAWRELVAEGAYEEMLSSLSPAQLEEAMWQGDERDVVNIAAAARRTGDARTRYMYSVVRARFAGTDAAANAAFMIARMEFHANAPDAAVGWLEIYLRERPDGRFAREAAGRLVEAYVQVGDASKARAAAERYLARYPDGPHAALARSVLP